MTFKSVNDIITGLTVLQNGRTRYESKLHTLRIQFWRVEREEWETVFLQVRQLCLSCRFWFERLEISNLYYNGWEPAIAGKLTHILCSGALPNVCEISLYNCSLTNEQFRDIARNTPLVERFIGDDISIESFSHSGEELRIWPNLRVLKLHYAPHFHISPGKSSVGLLSSVASKLEQVVLVDIDVKMAGVGLERGDIEDMYMEFILSAPKLSQCVIRDLNHFFYLSGKNRERLRVERPELSLDL